MSQRVRILGSRPEREKKHFFYAHLNYSFVVCGESLLFCVGWLNFLQCSVAYSPAEGIYKDSAYPEQLEWQIYNTRQYLVTEGELWQVDKSLAVAVRSVVCQRLNHVVSLQTSLLHSHLHLLHGLHTGHGVKVTVDSHNLGTCRTKYTTCSNMNCV